MYWFSLKGFVFCPVFQMKLNWRCLVGDGGKRSSFSSFPPLCVMWWMGKQCTLTFLYLIIQGHVIMPFMWKSFDDFIHCWSKFDLNIWFSVHPQHINLQLIQFALTILLCDCPYSYSLFLTIAAKELGQHLFVVPESSSGAQDWPLHWDTRAKINSCIVSLIRL